MYIVVSYDFGGSSSVMLHSITADLLDATAVYERIASSVSDYNRRYAHEGLIHMVELVSVPSGFSDDRGFQLFWSRTEDDALTGISVLRTNNGRTTRGSGGPLAPSE